MAESHSGEAAECARAMDGRFFAGRRISASFYPLASFYDGAFDLDGAVVQQVHRPT